MGWGRSVVDRDVFGGEEMRIGYGRLVWADGNALFGVDGADVVAFAWDGLLGVLGDDDGDSWLVCHAERF